MDYSLLGVLNGHRYDLDFFSRIPDRFGDYERVEKILLYRGIGSALHNRRHRVMAEKGRDILHSKGLRFSSNEEVSVHTERSFLKPDVAVGLSLDSSDTYEYVEGKSVPVAVCEITSFNWRNDFNKAEIYASLGVLEYLILHLNGDDVNSSAAFEVYRFSGNELRERSFASDGCIDTTWFGTLHVDELNDPVSPRIRRKENYEYVRQLERRVAELEERALEHE